MDIPERRHPKCPNVHVGSCPECRRLWIRDAESQRSESPALVAPVSAVVADPQRERIPSSSDGDVSAGRKADVATADRLEAGREVLTVAERSARYRAKQKLEGPEFLEREKLRMRARRKK